MKIKKSKKGELTTQQIVILIIVITSFVIILFLLFRLNLGETSNKEICHNSVVLKSKGEGLVGKLDCKTNYVCISGGGDCEDISPTATIKIDLSKPNAKNETMKAIADEMADCWWMFGEGELNYVGATIGGGTNCAICSIVKFDNKILEKDYKISYREFYGYLNSISKDATKTYFTYLYNSYDVEKFQNEVSYLKIDLDKDFILNNEKYAVLTGVKKGAVWGAVIGDIFIYPYYLQSDEMSSKLEEKCDDVITKAA